MSPVNINESKEYVEKSRNELPSKIFDLQSPESYKSFMTKNYLKAFAETFELASMGSPVNKKVEKKVSVEHDPSSPVKIKVFA